MTHPDNNQREWDIVCPQCSKPQRVREDSYTFHGTTVFELDPSFCHNCGLSYDAIPWSKEPWNGPEN